MGHDLLQYQSKCEPREGTQTETCLHDVPEIAKQVLIKAMLTGPFDAPKFGFKAPICCGCC
ncbi:hypothetical protein NC651_032142 [Populus alba x Populus x berolinensis]|nr:hypothetical protein NC651_032142 [Populus alba x Populus x berolinensis]